MKAFAKSYSKPIKILCLHGKGGCSELFSRKLLPLSKRLELLESPVVFSFLDAPYVLHGNETSRAWWLLPEGIRSFDAESYDGSEESIRIIENCVQEECVDILLGHSQGAMIASIVLAKSVANKNTKTQSLRAAILSSAAWPLPYETNILSLTSSTTKFRDVFTLHTIAENDGVNPSEHSKRIMRCFQAASSDDSVFVKSIHHNSGHIFPLDTVSI